MDIFILVLYKQLFPCLLSSIVLHLLLLSLKNHGLLSGISARYTRAKSVHYPYPFTILDLFRSHPRFRLLLTSRYCALRLRGLVSLFNVLQPAGCVLLGIFHLRFDLIYPLLLGVHQMRQILRSHRESLEL